MRKKHKALKLFAILLASVSILSIGALAFLYFYARNNINYEADELLFEKSQSWEPTVFYAVRSTDAEFTPEETERIGDVRRRVYSLDSIAREIKEGFLAVEDQRFYSHSGVDVGRTLLAAVNYVFRTRKLFGASTVTQQVVKNISGDNQQTPARKLSEILRAINIEKRYSKDEILEVYLNIVPMGNNCYGVGTAAETYFGKTPGNLTAAEAATLIGIANAPSTYNPYKNIEACTAKRNRVLAVMHSTGVIGDAEYTNAVDTELDVLPLEEKNENINSWFVETCLSDVCRDLAAEYSITESAARMMITGGGYSIYTTMDKDVQHKLEEYFEDYGNFPSEINNGLNYSMVVTDSQSGDIVGIIGRVGKKKGNRLLNHATALHTPASAMKPLAIYAPLIDSGVINWSTVIDDTPEYVGGGGAYPHNSPDIYNGLTTVKDAIRTSKNTVAVKLGRRLGERRIFDRLRTDHNFSTLVERRTEQNGRSYTDIAISPMALGQLTDGISLRTLTEAYGVFPGDGIRRGGRTYYSVRDSEGREVLQNNISERRIYKSSTARIMNQLLRAVTESGTAKRITLNELVDTAGKTGTSSGSLDKLFVGYTPYYTAGIWCGYDGGSQGVSSSVSHLKIWDDVMLSLHSEVINDINKMKFSTDGLVLRPYCMDSGELYCDKCKLDPRGSRLEYGYFTPDNAPSRDCHRHITVKYDTVSKGVADPTCPLQNTVDVSLLYIPERSFARQVIISDAELVYRLIPRDLRRPESQNLPYFIYALPEGEYVGITGNKKQFNSAGKVYE